MRPAAEQLRVAIVSDAAPDRNGVGAYHRDLTAHLEPIIDQVELICPEYGEEPLPQWVSIPLPGDATQRVGIPSPRTLKERIAAVRPHTVVVATPGVHGILGARYAGQVGARLIYAMHTHYENLTRLYWRGVLRPVNQAYLRNSNRHLLNRAHCVVAVSDEMRELALRDALCEVRLVGTLLPPPFLGEPAPERGRTIGKVLFLGRLAAEKRVPAVIDAAERLPDLEFRIAGEGPLRDEVEAAARRLANLDYLGWVPRPEVRALLDDSDMLVLPSTVEAFGTVALEALARNVVTLVSPGCGIRDWQHLARSLYTIGVGESLSGAIRRVSEVDPAIRRRKSRLGREAVEEMNRDTLEQWLDILSPGSDESRRKEA